jgi:ribosomal protein S18 acetylase RimI-like enzyme
VAASTERTRVASEADAEEVAELLDGFQAEFDEYTPGADVLVGRVRDHIARGLSVFLLAGPPRVGVAQLRFREWLLTGEPICYVEELYVVPGRRGQGHGRALMEAAMDLAHQDGATTIELTTATSDRAARGLYERLGFTNLERAGDPETQMLYYERELR